MPIALSWMIMCLCVNSNTAQMHQDLFIWNLEFMNNMQIADASTVKQIKSFFRKKIYYSQDIMRAYFSCIVVAKLPPHFACNYIFFPWNMTCSEPYLWWNTAMPNFLIYLITFNWCIKLIAQISLSLPSNQG